jgi:ubiquinone/menaquinone biosynthesis C-methylase UbiE
MSQQKIKKDVKEFYNQVGWHLVDQEHYQNARYEDLRPVASEYIHRCHMRVNKHLAANGQYFLDAGSGPVQYPEYLSYSSGYHARVCMDISIQALMEARRRLKSHGFYVVGDIAHLPFKSNIFDGIVSLHTIHHIPMEEKLNAYEGLFRTLKPDRKFVVVEGWTNARLMKRLSRILPYIRRFRGWWERNVLKQNHNRVDSTSRIEVQQEDKPLADSSPIGTFVKKVDADMLDELLNGKMEYKILVWRSVSVELLRTVIHPDWGGRFWLKLLFWLEERFPRYFGRYGQYPLIVISKE